MDNILKDLLLNKKQDKDLRLFLQGTVDGEETWMYRYEEEISWKVEHTFMHMHKSGIMVDRDELGCGCAWWCVLVVRPGWCKDGI